MAVTFDGSNQKISTGYEPSWAIADSFTICFCFNTTTTTSGGYFFGTQVSTTLSRVGLAVTSPLGLMKCQLIFYDSNNSGTSRIGNITINDGFWHHAAIVRDRSMDTIYLYLDGVIDVGASGGDGTTGNCNFSSYSLSIGANRTGTSTWTNYLACSIEDFGIWNIALTPQEISTLATYKDLQSPSVELSHLVRWWELRGVTNTTYPVPTSSPSSGTGVVTYPSWTLPHIVGYDAHFRTFLG